MKLIKQKFKSILSLASGCTEPAAIAYNGNFIGKYLKDIKSIELLIDEKTFRNAFNAGIPNSAKKGTKWALFLGIAAAKPSLKLDTFSSVTKKTDLKAEMILKNVEFKINVVDKKIFYLKTISKDNFNNRLIVEIAKSHRNLKLLQLNDKIIQAKRDNSNKNSSKSISIPEKYYDFETWEAVIEYLFADKEILKLLKKAVLTNLKLLDSSSNTYGKENHYGLGEAVLKRMKGENYQVYTCSNSGIKGLAATIPLYNFAKENNITEEKMLKAVLLTVFVTELFTQKLGVVTSACGVIYCSGPALIAGILYLENNLADFFNSFRNYFSSYIGVFCTGANKSCTQKSITALTGAFQSMKLTNEGLYPDLKDGILGETLLHSIKNLDSYSILMEKFNKETLKILKEKL